MNKQQLAAKIWESANRMRGKVDASEYKDFILGFIFYKYLSEKEEQFFLGEGMTAADMEQLVEEDEETVGYAQNHLGYFISYQNLFSTWVQAGNDFAVSQVYEALSAFSRLVSPLYKNVFDGIFITLQTGLSKLGDNTGSQTKAVRDLVHLIQTIPMSTHQDYDVLGYIYEDSSRSSPLTPARKPASSTPPTRCRCSWRISSLIICGARTRFVSTTPRAALVRCSSPSAMR